MSRVDGVGCDALILRWMALLDENDGQLLWHNDGARRILIDDMDP